MRAVTAIAVVRPDHTLTVSVPADVPPGPQNVVVVFQDGQAAPPVRTPLTFAPHPTGPVDSNCTYRREDVYGDDGR